MKRKVRVIGYDITRTTDRNYTHAVVFRNLSSKDSSIPAASFHMSDELANIQKRRYEKCYWLEIVEIARVEEVTR